MSQTPAQLQELIDRDEIVQTVLAYATAVDTRDWATLRTLFTDDGAWEYAASGERVSGPEAIAARIGASIERLDATQHMNSNHVMALRGDEADHTCYFQAHHLRGTQRFVGAGRYEDRLRRTADGWRFTRRRIVSVWHEGDPSIFAD
ncbi:MAG TPA: nuclear transport factor 2 family protein [Actinocrinis sp.]|nr:nuclear transport factor 2 family protein [Actinocrinis sp.]